MERGSMKVFNRGEAAIVTIDTRICPKSYVEIPDETALILVKMYPALLLIKEDKVNTAKLDAAKAELKAIEDKIAARNAELEAIPKPGRPKKVV